MTPASVMQRFKANGASLMSDFHRAPLKMAWLRLCRITNESTEIDNCYSSLNRELRWLWNSVYSTVQGFFTSPLTPADNFSKPPPPPPPPADPRTCPLSIPPRDILIPPRTRGGPPGYLSYSTADPRWAYKVK